MGLKTYIKRKLMSLRDIFKDENDINEKNVVGFLAFFVMVIFAAVDIITGISRLFETVLDTSKFKPSPVPSRFMSDKIISPAPNS